MKTVIEKIKNHQLKAREAHNKKVTGSLTALLSEIYVVGKTAGNRETTPAEALVVITKFLKNVKETIALVSKDTTMDQEIKDTKIEDLKAEVKLYESYLPKQLTEAQLKFIINDLIDYFKKEAMSINMGVIMKFLKENHGGLYDGKLASSLVRELIPKG